MKASYRQFGTLSIGIFLSNLNSRQLETSLMTSYGHFWNLSTFGDSRAIWVFLLKLGTFRKSVFSMKEWKVFHKPQEFKVARSLGYMMVPFWGCVPHLKGCHGPLKNVSCIFQHIWRVPKVPLQLLTTHLGWEPTRIQPSMWPITTSSQINQSKVDHI